MKYSSNPSDKRTEALEKVKVGTLLWRFSLPAITGMVVHALYNVIDRIFIGQGVGSLGLAAVTIAFPIMVVILSINMLIGLGATAVISIRLGEKRNENAEKVLGNAIASIIIIFSLLSILTMINIDSVLILFGATEEILPMSKSYMSVILLGMVFAGVGFVMNNCVRGEGNPKIAMITMLIGAFLNMILDPIFIFGFKWGVRGAAIATVISQIATTIWLLFYYLSGKSLLKIRIANLKLNRKIIISILSIGFAPFAMQFAASLIFILYNHQVRIYGGELGLSVIGVVFSLNMLIMMPSVGIAQGGQPIIGYNFGAGNIPRVKRTLQLAILAATSVSLVGFLILTIFTDSIVRLFNRSNPEFIVLGKEAIRICTMFLPVVGFQIIGSNYFQAVGKAKNAALLSLSRQVLILIPALLILPLFLDLKGVFFALPAADIGSAILTGIFIKRELSHLSINPRKNR